MNKTLSENCIKSMDQIQAMLGSAKRVLVASHLNPDGDAIGTVLAFGRYLSDAGKEVTMVRDPGIPDKYRFLPGVDRILPVDSLLPGYSCDIAVILECPDMSRLGEAFELITPEVSVINIDHHTGNGNYGAINWINDRSSSVAEMVYEYFQHAGYKVDREVATSLYTAILTDTGRFRYDSTSPRTMQIAGELIGYGAHADEICKEVYYNQPPSRISLLGKALNTAEFDDDGTICTITLLNKMYEESGASQSEADGLVEYTLFTRGVKTGALLKEIDTESTRVSLRSVQNINVAAIANSYGGGGHNNAAGCTIKKPISAARKEIIERLKEATRNVTQSV